MLKTISALYQTPDLIGEALVSPLKRYHQNFQDKTNNSKGLSRGAWLAANVFTGIILYPTLGAVAGVGMMAKLCGVPFLKAHNERLIEVLDVARMEYEAGRVYNAPLEKISTPVGYTLRETGDVLGYSAGGLKVMAVRIELLSSVFRRAFFQIVHNEAGLVGMQVYILDPVNVSQLENPLPDWVSAMDTLIKA